MTRTSTSTRLDAADPLEGLLLQHAHDLALGLERHVGDLVEEQRAAVRPLEDADLARRAVARRFSVPNSSISSRSGRIVAQLTATNGPLARRERACSSRPTTSLPAPGGPVISTRLPVGADPSICWRSWLAAERGADQVEIAAGAQPQLFVLAPQRARPRSRARRPAAAGRT